MADPVLTRRRFITGCAGLGAATLLSACGPRAATAATPFAVFLRLTPYERAFFERVVLPPFERQHNARIVFASGTVDEVAEASALATASSTSSRSIPRCSAA